MSLKDLNLREHLSSFLIFAIVVILAYYLLVLIISLVDPSVDPRIINKDILLALFSGIVGSMCFYTLKKLSPVSKEEN